MFFSRQLLAKSNLILPTTQRLDKIYHSIADIEFTRKNPPSDIKAIKHCPGGHFIQLPADFNNTVIGNQSNIKKNLTHHTALKVITFPGIAVEKILVPLLKTAKAELESTNNHSNFYEIAASYVPQYPPLERYNDLLTYYINEAYIGKESRYIVENILLPLAIHHKDSHGPIILKGFSMGGHELKMAFTYLIQILQSNGYTDSQIAYINKKFIVYSVGTSLNWSQENPLHHLYPRIIHVLAIIDKGITHLKATSDLINGNPPVFEIKTEDTVMTRNNHPTAQEIIIIPPPGKMRDTREKDHCHNANSYESIVQQNLLLKPFLTRAYNECQKSAKIYQKQDFFYQQPRDIIRQRPQAF
jgi:hypothetical protein